MLRPRQLNTVVVCFLAACLLAVSARATEEVEPPQSEGPRPTVTIVAPPDGAQFHERQVVLDLSVKNPGEETLELKALVDGRPALATRGVALVQSSSAAESAITHRMALMVPAQDCVVTVYAVTAHAKSEPAALRLRWQGAPPPAIKPKLYVLAVGVTDYELPELRLRYPAKDARDLATVLTEQAGTLYGSVQTRILTDRDATRASILDGLQWLERQTTARDVAVLFLGGHGLNDPSTGEYYYLPYDADPGAIKRTMIPGGTFQTSLRSIAGRVVLFLDTCHGGNVLGQSWQLRGDPDLQGIANELASGETGVVVFTASTRRQSAKEDPEWENGAFTKAVVEALRGQGIPGSPGLQRITINMLDVYISERVKQLTLGTQTPTTAKPNTLADFTLAVFDRSPHARRAPMPPELGWSQRRGLDVISAGADFITPLQPDGGFGFRLWPHLALSLKVAGREQSALAFRLAGGPVVGRAPQIFLAPDGTVVESDGRSLLGALFEFGLQLRFLRQHRYRPSFDAGVMLGGVSYGAPTLLSGAMLLSFPLRARLSIGRGAHAVAIVLGVLIDWPSEDRHRYTGAGAAYVTESRTWALQGTLGVSYEYKTKRVE